MTKVPSIITMHFPKKKSVRCDFKIHKKCDGKEKLTPHNQYLYVVDNGDGQWVCNKCALMYIPDVIKQLTAYAGQLLCYQVQLSASEFSKTWSLTDVQKAKDAAMPKFIKEEKEEEAEDEEE